MIIKLNNGVEINLKIGNNRLCETMKLGFNLPDLMIVDKNFIMYDDYLKHQDILNRNRRNNKPLVEVLYKCVSSQSAIEIDEGFILEDDIVRTEESYITDLRKNKLDRILKND